MFSWIPKPANQLPPWVKPTAVFREKSESSVYCSSSSSSKSGDHITLRELLTVLRFFSAGAPSAACSRASPRGLSGQHEECSVECGEKKHRPAKRLFFLCFLKRLWSIFPLCVLPLFFFCPLLFAPTRSSDRPSAAPPALMRFLLGPAPFPREASHGLVCCVCVHLCGGAHAWTNYRCGLLSFNTDTQSFSKTPGVVQHLNMSVNTGDGNNSTS